MTAMTAMTAMTVAELIAHLQKYPQHLPVAYHLFSEATLLLPDDICVVQACEARDDGWVHSARPDKPWVEYLMLPGN